MHIIIGTYGSDAGWLDLDTETGILTHHGGYTPVPEEFKRVLQVVKHGAEVKDDMFRTAMIKAASEFFQKSEIRGPDGNLIAIF